MSLRSPRPLGALQKLLTLGADVNHENANNDGLTAFQSAILGKNEAVFDLFIDTPDINVKVFQNVKGCRENLLHLAYDNPYIILKLLARGVSPYEPPETYSALHKTVKASCDTQDWSLMNPYLEWKGLKMRI